MSHPLSHKVVINHEEQYSIWPADRPVSGIEAKVVYATILLLIFGDTNPDIVKHALTIASSPQSIEQMDVTLTPEMISLYDTFVKTEAAKTEKSPLFETFVRGSAHNGLLYQPP